MTWPPPEQPLVAEHYTAYGRQLAGCGHVVEPGATLTVLRAGTELTAVPRSMCPTCWAELGRAGNGDAPR